jgi:carboxypeptidase C (cathepsin A)
VKVQHRANLGGTWLTHTCPSFCAVPTLEIDQTLSFNEYSWNTNAHFLFVDQPIGTGLSSLSAQGTNATYATTIGHSTAQLYSALQGFYQQFPNLQANPFFITGESYGGKYIPNLARAILDGQSDFKLNLAGLAIGNGW